MVQLRNSGSNTSYALAPGQSVAVIVKATTPSGCASYALTTQVKQSNDFSGAGNDFSLVGSQPSVTVSPGSTLGSFVVASIATPQAGSPITITATAKDTCGNAMTTYGGGATLSGNIATSPGGYAPVYGAFSWNAGVGTATATAYATTSFNGSYQPDFSVTVSGGSVTKTSNSFAVTPGLLGSFTVGSLSSPQTAGSAFTVNATAYDLYGNLKRDYGGGATLNGNLVNAPNGAQPQYGTFGTWTNGSASDPGVTAFATSSYDASTHSHNADFSVTVSDNGKTGTSSQFAVKPGPLASFGWSTPPAANLNAGIPFGAGVTAYDASGNVKTDYSVITATVGGLGTSPGNLSGRPTPSRGRTASRQGRSSTTRPSTRT